MAHSDESVKTLNRMELYDLVWSEPMSRLAPKYGISDVGFAKICRSLLVPTPPVGYWQKLRNGHKVRRTQLRKLPEEEEKRFWIQLTKRELDEGRALTEAEVMIRTERDSGQIVVTERNGDLHPLVGQTDKSIRNAKGDKNGLVSPKAQGCLRVSVSPASIDRAMRILDALIRALESRGFPVTVTHEATEVEILCEKIPFYLTELLDRKEKELSSAQKRDRDRYSWLSRRSPEYDYFPSGRLALQIDVSTNRGTRRQWSDGKSRRLEAQLNAFIAGLIRTADNVKECRREREEWERKFKENQERRREEELRRLEEEARTKQFQAAAAAYQSASVLRQYVEAVRAAAVHRTGFLDSDSEVGRWIEWADRQVAAIDPLSDGKTLPAFSVSNEQRERWRWEGRFKVY